MTTGIIFLAILLIVYFAYNVNLWRRVNEPASEAEKRRPVDGGMFSSHDHERFKSNFLQSISPHHKEQTMVRKNLRQAIISLALFTVITGLVYPLLVTGVAQVLFPWKANGSLITKNGRAVGSALVGQPFSEPKYFWGRLSATAPAYNGGASSGSNYGPLNPALLDAAKQRIRDLRGSDSLDSTPIPVDLVTASGSGLDPDITIAGALYQVKRVAHARHTDPQKIRELIDRYTERRQLGILGEPRINVLQLNLALDELQNLAEAN